MTRRTFLSASAAASTLGAGPRPNILLIHADDLRFDDASCIGRSALRTPNFDGLAARGIRFRNSFVTTAICCSSRASLPTGQHLRRHGIHDFATPLQPAQLASSYMGLLREAGYRTALLGKYAIGNPAAHGASALPKDAFDYWYGFPQSINFLQVDQGQKRHLTPLMVEHASEFLRSQPRDRPFCMALHFKEPHGPWNFFDPGRPDEYKSAPVTPPKTQTRSDFEALPGFIRASLSGEHAGDWNGGAQEHFLNHARTCFHLVAGVDQAVGRILELLGELGLEGNTVVIFTSDNGDMRGAHGLSGKWLMYEESIRVPLIIHDPRGPSKSRGTVRDDMALNIDLAPTMLRLAGVKVPESMQGQDLMGPVNRKEWYYHHTYKTPAPRRPIPVNEGVRAERWKYVRYPEQNYEQMFDLRSDPLERTNLAGNTAHARRLDAMRRRCEELGRAAA